MIAIYEDGGWDYNPEDYVPTAVYDDGEWLVDNHDWERYYPPGTPEEYISEQLTGPSAVVVEITDDPQAVIEEAKQHEGFEGPGTYADDSDKDTYKRSGVGPPQATLLGVGDDVETVAEGEESDEGDDTEKGKESVESPREAPDDAIVHVDVDEEGDPDEVYYEQE